MTLYLSVAQLLEMHRLLVAAFGGAKGVRERGGLEAAAARPAATFGGDDLYPDLASKAAALMHSMLLNPPFVDGNTRVGAAAAELFVRINGADLTAADEEFETVAIDVATGDVAVEALAIWLRQRIRESR